MPAPAGRQNDRERNLAVGEHGAARAVGKANDNAAREILAAIQGREALVGFGPHRGDSASNDGVFPLDLEKVGEIAADLDFESKRCLTHAVVRDIQVLMEAIADRSRYRQPQSVLFQLAAQRVQFRVGQNQPGQIIVRVRGVQQLPRLPLRRNAPAAYQPRIAEKQSFLARRSDGAVGLADQHTMAVVNRKVGRSNLDLY